jgi:hypothetical protein
MKSYGTNHPDKDKFNNTSNNKWGNQKYRTMNEKDINNDGLDDTMSEKPL